MSEKRFVVGIASLRSQMVPRWLRKLDMSFKKY